MGRDRGRGCRWRACLALTCRGQIRERRVGREDHNSANEPRPSTNNQPSNHEHPHQRGTNKQTITEQNTTKATATANTMALLVPDFFDHIFADLHGDVVDLSSCKKVCRPSASRMAWPKVDVTEEEDKFVGHADVPGVPKDKLKVEVKDNGITLSFDQEEKKEETTQQGKTIRKERYYSAFTRTLPIPKGVDKENISAAYTDGVLTLALPKAPESVPKSITIA